MLYVIERKYPGHDQNIEYITRRRIDAARLMLMRMVYNAAEGQGLRDRQVAHDAMHHAGKYNRQSNSYSIRIGDQVVNIKWFY